MAERGEVVGTVVALVQPDKTVRSMLIGLCTHDRALASYAAGRLHLEILDM